MVGKGVLYECFDHPDVEKVLVVNRRPIGIAHEKLEEIVHPDFYNFTTIEDKLQGYNACYFCLGVSAFRMSEADYTRITYDLTLNFAKVVLNRNPDIVFCYASGVGTDSTEKSRTMWARVKGKTENDLLAMDFRDSYMFRPGYIQPMKGIRSSTKLYNAMYAVFKPLYPVFKIITPNGVTSTAQVGKSMINIVKHGYDHRIITSRDINALATMK